MRPLSRIKQLFVPRGRSPRTVRSGVFKGLRMHLDLSCQTQLFVGTFERETHHSLTKLSRGAQTAIDIGVAEGEYSLFLLAKTQIKQLFAFEPCDWNRSMFISNLKLNGFETAPRLQVSSQFVGAEDSDSMRTLDSLLPQILEPVFIKMDVDGAEMKILNGASALLALPRVRWIIETHSKQLERDCVAVLQSKGFSTQIVPNAWWRCVLPEQRGNEQNRWLVAAKPADSVL